MRASTQKMLQAKDIHFAYSGKESILKGLSLDIQAGNFLAILGVNGSGKSTLLSCLDDLLKPQSGSVLLDGKDFNAYSREDRAKKIAYVPQHSHANGVVVYDAILLGRMPYVKTSPSKKDYEIVDRVIEELNLGDLAMCYLDEISGGEYQKVVIARALAQETEYLLLDEPTNNLDLANQAEVMQILRNISDAKKAAVATVMHDINLAIRFCERFALMKDGQILAYGGHEILTKETIEMCYSVNVELIESGESVIVLPSKED